MQGGLGQGYVGHPQPNHTNSDSPDEGGGQGNQQGNAVGVAETAVGGLPGSQHQAPGSRNENGGEYIGEAMPLVEHHGDTDKTGGEPADKHGYGTPLGHDDHDDSNRRRHRYCRVSAG